MSSPSSRSTPTAEPLPPLPPTPAERARAVLFFVLTTVSVYLVYGYQWMAGDPLGDGEVAWGSGRFAVALMAILLAHEMGHYQVARRHGFHLSLPYFIPLPFAFGTLGAIIRLRSMPRGRTALLEMAAAGPLAGFAVAVLVMALGLPETVEHAIPQYVLPLPGHEPTGGLLVKLLELPAVNAALGAVDRALVAILDVLGATPAAAPEGVALLILANPPIMDLLGAVILGHAPGRYADMGPLAMASWVGCLLTAINLLPIGQLDGGHIFNALAPRHARLASRVGIGVALVAGMLWAGWAVWALMLLGLQAWRSLPVPGDTALSTRARWLAGAAALALGASFMPMPLELETLATDEVEWVYPDGSTVPDEIVRQRYGAAPAPEEVAPEPPRQ